MQNYLRRYNKLTIYYSKEASKGCYDNYEMWDIESIIIHELIDKKFSEAIEIVANI